MIQGIGIDLIEIERIRRVIARQPRFLNYVFTQQEQDYCHQFTDPAPRFAARFSAKEAVAKALGVGIGKELGWQEIEVIHKVSRKPEIHLQPAAAKRFSHPKLWLSISHSQTMATAYVIAEL